MEAPHTPPSPCRAPRDEALSKLEVFRSRVLPSVLRRMAIWKHIEGSTQQELAADAMQELAVDCLAHPDEVLALNERDRHTRWIRMVQRLYYAMRERTARKTAGDDSLELLEIDAETPFDLPIDTSDRDLLQRMLQSAELLKNGRISLRGTARTLGVSANTLAELRIRVVEALGYGDEHEQYWRGRLAEALCSTAAAWLRHDGELNLWDDAHRRGFEPEQCLARFARIREALALRPAEPETRQALDLVLGAADGPCFAVTARELLRIAERFAPRDESVLLWRFEAEIVGAALAPAARCLRRASRVSTDRVRVLLARARLLEARGRLDAARALLQRAAARHRGEPRIAASLNGIDVARRYAPSAVSIASPSSSSRLA